MQRMSVLKSQAEIISTERDEVGTSELVQRLICHVTASMKGHQEANENDLLLDIEVDGVRCILMCLRQPEHACVNSVLSPREQEIARMVAKGYPNKTIAAVLEISAWTVNTHLRRIFAKLGVSTRAAMVARLSEPGKSDLVELLDGVLL